MATIGVETAAGTLNDGSNSKNMGTGSNRICIVFFSTTSASPTAPTINGVAMTQSPEGTATLFSGRYGNMYYMVNPPTGSQTVLLTDTDGGAFVVLNNVDPTSPIDASGKLESDGPSTGHSKAITVVASNCWMIAGFNFNAGTLSSVSGVLTTSAGGGPAVAHSNGTVSTGSQTATCTSTMSSTGGMNLISVKPYAPTININETLTITPTLSTLSQFFRTLTETVTITATISSIRTLFITLTDSISISEIFRRTLNGASTIWNRMSKNAASWTNQNKS